MADTNNTPSSLAAEFQSAKPVISDLKFSYLVASDTGAHEKAKNDSFYKTQDEIKLRNGDLTGEQVSRTVNVPRSILVAQAEKKRKTEQGDNHLLLMGMLNDLRDRLDTLERNMAESFEQLQSKYGDDVIGGMAATYLSPDELAGLNTDDDKLRALADKFLDENGEIKSEYKDLEEAKYVRDWSEAQKLKPIVAQYDGRNALSQQEIAQIKEAVQNTSLADNKNMIALSENQQLKETVDQAVDNSAKDLDDTQNSITVNFGSPS